MTLIARYLIKQLSITTLYAMFALLALYSFFDIVAEVGGVGEGGYTGIKMMQYVLLQIPDHAYQMMPLAVLIGGLIALSWLAANSEMTVIKTSGMSTKNIIAILLGLERKSNKGRSKPISLSSSLLISDGIILRPRVLSAVETISSLALSTCIEDRKSVV